MIFHACDDHGGLMDELLQIATRRRCNAPDSSSKRVGACRDLFLSLLDEGLQFLHLYQQGKLAIKNSDDLLLLTLSWHNKARFFSKFWFSMLWRIFRFLLLTASSVKIAQINCGGS